jgi:hypothetical protein
MAQQVPAGRYGKSNRPRRRWSTKVIVVVLGAAMAVAAGAVTWLTFRSVTHPDVQGTLITFNVVNDSTMSIELTVARDDPSRPAVCIVRARSRDGSETGRRELYIPPSQSTTVQVVTEVKSSQPPGVGDLYGCGFDVPAYLER